MPAEYRKLVDHGRHLRQFVNEPVTSLVHQDDLSFVASRLLLLGQYVRRADQGLADLIESSLEDLARLNPESAIQRIRQAGQTWYQSPVYWALCCHALAQVLSEYSSDVSATTITELRSSLGEWFPRFRQSLESHSGSPDEKHFVGLQAFMTQCAIFHDAEAMEWVCQRIFSLLTPDTIVMGAALETACIVSGACQRPQDQENRARLFIAINNASQQNPEVKKAGEAMGADHIANQANYSGSVQMLSGKQLQSGDGKKRKKSKSKNKDVHGSPFWESVAQYSWLLAIIPILLVAGCCMWGFGAFYDWFEHSSPVGDQSLGDWYDKASAQRKAEEGEEESPADAAENEDGGPEANMPSEADSPTPTPWPTPVETPRETVTDSGRIRELFDETLEKHTQWMKSRVGVPRMARSVQSNGQLVKVHAEYINSTSHVSQTNGAWTAIAWHQIRWFESGQAVGVHKIEARYTWTGNNWDLVGALRDLNVRDEAGNPVYARDTEEREWVDSLFEKNPFYE